MTITRKCPMCGAIITKEIDDKYAKAIDRYQSGIGYIQDIPLDADTREFIKSGYCPDCMEMLFGFEEEEAI